MRASFSTTASFCAPRRSTYPDSSLIDWIVKPAAYGVVGAY